MPTRFTRVGTCYINPWSTAGVVPANPPRPDWCNIIMHSGEAICIDAGVEAVVEAIELACKDDGIDDAPLAMAVGHGRA